MYSYSTYIFSEKLPIPIFSAPIYFAKVQYSFGSFLIRKRKGGCDIFFFRLKYKIDVTWLSLNVSSVLSVGKHSCTQLLRQDRRSHRFLPRKQPEQQSAN